MHRVSNPERGQGASRLKVDTPADVPFLWTHDDNMAVQIRGWGIYPTIVSASGESVVDILISSKAGMLMWGTKRAVWEGDIVPNIDIDPLMRKAYTILIAQRFKYPNLRDFCYSQE